MPKRKAQTMTALGNFYRGSDTPTGASDGDLWIDTTYGPPFVLKVRNGSGWDEFSLVARDGSGNLVASVAVQPTGGVDLKAAAGAVQMAINESGINADVGSAYLRLFPVNGAELAGDAGIRLPYLPTSDPASAEALWNDNGTVKVSAG